MVDPWTILSDLWQQHSRAGEPGKILIIVKSLMNQTNCVTALVLVTAHKCLVYESVKLSCQCQTPRGSSQMNIRITKYIFFLNVILMMYISFFAHALVMSLLSVAIYACF